MKLDNKRLFTADIYEITDYKLEKYLEMSDCVAGGVAFKDKLKQKNVVVVRFKDRYVPIGHMTNLYEYVRVLVNEDDYSRRDVYLSDHVPVSNNNHIGDLFLKNIKPLFSVPGRTSLKELVGIQKYTAENDDTFQGGMIM